MADGMRSKVRGQGAFCGLGNAVSIISRCSVNGAFGCRSQAAVPQYEGNGLQGLVSVKAGTWFWMTQRVGELDARMHGMWIVITSSYQTH